MQLVMDRIFPAVIVALILTLPAIAAIKYPLA
jgi:hypothetical protein